MPKPVTLTMDGLSGASLTSRGVDQFSEVLPR